MKRLTTITVTLILLLSSSAIAQQGWRDNEDAGNKQQRGRNHQRQDVIKELREEFRDEVKAFRQEQKSKRQAFTQTLSVLSPEERYAAMKQYAQEQHSVQLNFHEDLYNKFYRKVVSRLNSNDFLTPEKKEEILAKIESAHQQKTQTHEQKFQESQAYVDDIWQNPNLSTEEKRHQIREYLENLHQEYKEERNANRKQRRQKVQERREYYQEIYDEV